MKSEITPLILSYNEEPNIARTITALSWSTQIVIVDSGSTDKTLEIARSAHPNVKVVTRDFDTHAMQWNFGLQQIKTPWVLTLDADYQLSEDIVRELGELDPAPDVVGYEARFQYRVFGHPLRASVYPPRPILFRLDSASYYDDGHTQRLRPNGAIVQLSGLVYHDDRKSLKHWLESQNRYSSLEARHLLSTPVAQLSFQDRLRRTIFFAAPAMFLYLLLWRRLILDGWPGWFYVAQRTIAELMLSKQLIAEIPKG